MKRLLDRIGSAGKDWEQQWDQDEVEAEIPQPLPEDVYPVAQPEATLRVYQDSAGSWLTEVWYDGSMIIEKYALSRLGHRLFMHESRAMRHARKLLRQGFKPTGGYLSYMQKDRSFKL